MKLYPLARPNITEKEKRYVSDVLDSGFLSMGPVYRKFEEKFAKTIGSKYSCSVSSGTSGLHLALIAAGIATGDEVITTPFSFVASANAILYVGATPVFVDIDPQTYNMDASKIERAITDRTKAILVVHIFGQTCDMDAIEMIAKKYHLKIIEDACESLCAEYKGRKAGTFGESAVFAFYPNKQITTGEGGMVVTDDKEVYERCASLRNQGRTENMQWLDHKYLGYNYRMDEMSAALGLAQLERIDFLLEERKQLAGMYSHILASHGDLVKTPFVRPDNTHTWFVYVVKLPGRVDRSSLIKKLSAAGIQTKPYLPSIHLFDFYRKRFGFHEGDFPTSEETSARTLALPFYIGLQRKDIEFICRTLVSLIQ